MIVLIPIKKTTVYEEIAKITSYIGASSVDDAGTPIYDRVATTEYDNELLNPLFESACSSVALAAQRFFVCINSTSDGIDIKLDMPSNYIGDYNYTLVANATNHVICSIIAQWFTVRHKTEVDTYTSKAVQHLNEFSNTLFHRRAPRRTEPE